MTKDEEALDKLEDGLRAAHQLIDAITALTGTPYRPAWAQPLFEGWRYVLATQRAQTDANKRLAAIATITGLWREGGMTAHNAVREIDRIQHPNWDWWREQQKTPGVSPEGFNRPDQA